MTVLAQVILDKSSTTSARRYATSTQGRSTGLMAEGWRARDQRGIPIRLQIHREKNRHNGYLVRSELPLGPLRSRQFPSFVHSPFRFCAISIVRTISSRRRCCARHPELLKWPIDHAGVLTFDLATNGRE